MTISDSGHDEDKDLAPIDSDHSESEPDNEDRYPGDNKIPSQQESPEDLDRGATILRVSLWDGVLIWLPMST